MYRAYCEVESERAARYLAQLCKHFAHKIPVEFDEGRGRAEFPMGRCDMEAAGGRLRLTCSAESQEALDKVMHIVEDHVVRFAWREEPTIAWRAPVA